ncbi:hypothetical protein, partial [Acidovorax sp.]|uniref:hypothetical protein n=1 Tax=Acidovorax sp. TaxID=1872122 RepID=UPI00391F694D
IRMDARSTAQPIAQLLANRATKQTPHAAASPKGKPAARRIAALPFACVAVLRGTQGALHCTALQAFAGAK